MANNNYAYVTRDEYQQVSKDPHSNKFHTSQILSAISMYAFPPYNMAGICDLVTYIEDGYRNTHLSEDGSIMGVTFNVIMPLQNLYLEKLKESYPNFLGSSQKYIQMVKDNKDHSEIINEIEKEFGKFITVDRSIFHVASFENKVNLISDNGSKPVIVMSVPE